MGTDTVGEILIELILDDVMAGGQLFEGNPYRDAQGKFTSQEASLLYSIGAMARARAEGIRLKGAGGSREQIRGAILASLKVSARTATLNVKGDTARNQATQIALPAARKEAAYHQQQIAAGKGAAPERMLRRYQSQAWLQMY